MHFGQKISQKILTNFLGLSYRLIYFNNFFIKTQTILQKKVAKKQHCSKKKAEPNARTFITANID